MGDSWFLSRSFLWKDSSLGCIHKPRAEGCCAAEVSDSSQISNESFFCDRVKLLNHQRRSKQNRSLCCEVNFLSASVAHSAHAQYDAVTG